MFDCFQPVGNVHAASDGVTFQAVCLYNVASANIGIVRSNPDDSKDIFADHLYASPFMADDTAKEYCDNYEALLKEYRGRHTLDEKRREYGKYQINR